MNRFTTDQGTHRRIERPASFSIPSLLAVGAAVLSLLVSAGWGLLLAIVAIVLGVIGFFMALSPRVRGGVVSVVAMIAGGAGVLIALLRFVF